MANPNFNPERAGLILADAFVMGDIKAGEKWGLTDRAIRGYRKRKETDEELERHYLKAKALLIGNWSEDAQVFMSKSMEKLVTLVGMAECPSQIGEIAKAVQIVGELLVTERALNGAESDSQGQAAAKAPGGASRTLPN